MQSLNASTIAQFIGFNHQVIHWGFRQGRLLWALIDQITLVRIWVWDNLIGTDGLHLAFLIHRGGCNGHYRLQAHDEVLAILQG